MIWPISNILVAMSCISLAAVTSAWLTEWYMLFMILLVQDWRNRSNLSVSTFHFCKHLFWYTFYCLSNIRKNWGKINNQGQHGQLTGWEWGTLTTTSSSLRRKNLIPTFAAHTKNVRAQYSTALIIGAKGDGIQFDHAVKNDDNRHATRRTLQIRVRFLHAPTAVTKCQLYISYYKLLFCRTEFEKELREEIRRLIPNPKNRFGTAGLYPSML